MVKSYSQFKNILVIEMDSHEYFDDNFNIFSVSLVLACESFTVCKYCILLFEMIVNSFIICKWNYLMYFKLHGLIL